MSSPIVNHWVAIEQILCYQKVAPGRIIIHEDHGHTRVKSSNADWTGS